MHEFGFGPAGFISPDDIEIMERNQIGVQAQGNDWHIHRPRHASGQTHAGRRHRGFTMDEYHLRGMWRHYAKLMDDPDHAAFVR